MKLCHQIYIPNSVDVKVVGVRLSSVHIHSKAHTLLENHTFVPGGNPINTIHTRRPSFPPSCPHSTLYFLLPHSSSFIFLLHFSPLYIPTNTWWDPIVNLSPSFFTPPTHPHPQFPTTPPLSLPFPPSIHQRPEAPGRWRSQGRSGWAASCLAVRSSLGRRTSLPVVAVEERPAHSARAG